MEYHYDSKTNLVSIKFRLRTDRLEEFIIGCKKFCLSKVKGKGLEFSFKRKEKKNKVFYRIKMVGPPEDIIFIIKQLDSMKEMDKFRWSDVIKQIKEDKGSK